MNQLLEQAITERKYVAFEYRNANVKMSNPSVEPLAIHYKWYARYLFAYSEEKKQYRTFKVARMRNLTAINKVSTIEHYNVEKLMKESNRLTIKHVFILRYLQTKGYGRHYCLALETQ